jgi:leucyl-tRNA synthetase
MLSCICPHIGEELWQLLGHDNTIAYEQWPTYDEDKCKDDTVEIGVQVNGKVRGTLEIAVDEDEASVKARGKEVAGVAKALEGKNIIKEIYVKGKIFNIVAK